MSSSSTTAAVPGATSQGTRTSLDPIEESSCQLRRLYSRLRFSRRYRDPARRVFERLPPPPQDRLDESLSETPLDIKSFTAPCLNRTEKEKTYLYLAYGSNLCEETFRGVRGIKPLAQVNVVVPSLRLTFDLPGVPYAEPCFANTAVRTPGEGHAHNRNAGGTDYHKDRWHKGLVGCVYEVTASDYAHIIATEGGGASYEDVLVTCYPLPDSDTVPESPTTPPLKAHTLFAASTPPPSSSFPLKSGRFTRPDPSYAQPSARYLKLITDGATELSLPAEYQTYLNGIRPYTITTKRQAMGQKLFLAIWLPFVLFIMTLGQKLSDEKGKAPKWLSIVSGWIFVAMWGSYDGAFKKVFGDGERTEGEDEDSTKQRRGSGFDAV